MNRNDCSIVQDLLPLYMEDMLRPDTVAYVEDHLSGCEGCSNLLAELKTETAPTPDAEETRKGDQRVLKSLWKKLTLQSSILVILGVVYLILHCFPWINPQDIEEGYNSNWLPLLLFTALPLYMGISESSHYSHSRNQALLRTGIILPVALVPLFFLIGNAQTLFFDFSQGKYENAAPAFRHETLWSLFSAAICPSFLLVTVCGLLITGIALYNIWSKHLQYHPSQNKRIHLFTGLAAFFSVLIFILHLIPFQSHSSAKIYPFAMINLLYGAIPFYLAIAACLCKTSSLKGAIGATMLTLPFPLFAIWPILASLFPSNIPNYFWMGSYTFAPLYNILFSCLSLLLSTTAICSVWYQLKQQTKE